MRGRNPKGMARGGHPAGPRLAPGRHPDAKGALHVPCNAMPGRACGEGAGLGPRAGLHSTCPREAASPAQTWLLSDPPGLASRRAGHPGYTWVHAPDALPPALPPPSPVHDIPLGVDMDHAADHPEAEAQVRRHGLGEAGLVGVLVCEWGVHRSICKQEEQQRRERSYWVGVWTAPSASLGPGPSWHPRARHRNLQQRWGEPASRPPQSRYVSRLLSAVPSPRDSLRLAIQTFAPSPPPGTLLPQGPPI